MDQILNDSHLEETIIHELIHAYDFHTIKYDWSNCLHFACAEVFFPSLFLF
jgi:inner membrane protease ATP23